MSIQPTTTRHDPGITKMTLLHLLPGALTMLLMLLAGFLLEYAGMPPGVPVLFVLIAPLVMLGQLGFLYYQGIQMNGRLSLQGIVLYRNNLLPWWKLIAVSLPLLVWLAIVWYVIKPPVNQFFIKHFFSWMPTNFFEAYFLNNLNQYAPSLLKLVGVLFTLSISFGGAVEELYFRGYLLPRMAYWGGWAPVVNTVLFSLYHFWSPWENAVRIL